MLCTTSILVGPNNVHQRNSVNQMGSRTIPWRYSRYVNRVLGLKQWFLDFCTYFQGEIQIKELVVAGTLRLVTHKVPLMYTMQLFWVLSAWPLSIEMDLDQDLQRSKWSLCVDSFQEPGNNSVTDVYLCKPRHSGQSHPVRIILLPHNGQIQSPQYIAMRGAISIKLKPKYSLNTVKSCKCYSNNF